MVYHIIILLNIKNTVQFYIIDMEWFSQYVKKIETQNIYMYLYVYLHKFICLYLHWTKSGNVYLMC